jgi:RNA polymerase sigma factor (sigma-70 family)
VDQAKAGSRAAFEELVALYHEDIFRRAHYRTRSRMDAEDLTQEIFMRARRLKSVDRFRGWLYSTALNRVRDFHRKRRFLVLSFTSSEKNDEKFVEGRRRLIDLKSNVEKERFEMGNLLDSEVLNEDAVREQFKKLEKARDVSP